jgi:uncharacterized protein (DUF1015 family)
VADVRAFGALRYDERVAGPLSALICPPYDVISPEQRRALEARDPRNFVRVELPDEDARGYARAAELLRAWIDEHALVPDEPSIYLHEHEFTVDGERRSRRGVFVALRLQPASDRVVLPHEQTFPKAKADRLELLRATRANTSPIFGMVDGSAMAALRGAHATPVGEATLGDDHHWLSRVSGPTLDRFRQAMRDQRVYLADGHHRYETALNYAEERRAGGDAPERFILAYLCALDDRGLKIFATHRIARGSGDPVMAAARRSFTATPIDRRALERSVPGIVLASGGQFTRLELHADADLSQLPAAWRTLPVAIAEELLVRPAREAGADITYEHDLEDAIDASRRDATAILLRAVDPATLRSVADAGERLPQKTTYFYPKVPAGLVIRTLGNDLRRDGVHEAPT